MCESFVRNLVKHFDVARDAARASIGELLPANYRVIAGTNVFQDAGDQEREGEEVNKGARVAVPFPSEAENGMLYLARPVKGYLPAGELAEIELDHEQRTQRTMKVSHALREVRTYDIEGLNKLTDEYNWGMDFRALASHKIVHFVLGKSPLYQACAIQTACKSATNCDLRTILQKVVSNDIQFVVDPSSCPSPKRANRPRPPKSPSPRTRIRPKQRRKLRRQLRTRQSQRRRSPQSASPKRR